MLCRDILQTLIRLLALIKLSLKPQNFWQGFIVADCFLHRSLKKLLFLAVFLFVLGGLQSAFANQLPGHRDNNLNIRVDRCHFLINHEETIPCCQSKACHQTAPKQRDLGTPEYQTKHKDPHPLVHESRTLTPQFKVGAAFHAVHLSLDATQLKRTATYRPLQALLNLRSTVLRH